MKLVEAWCTDLRSRDMRTIDTKTIINFFERFYIIHEKIHHRVVLIRACMMSDPTCIEELVAINNLDNRFLREQKRITKIIQSLRSKTFF